MSRTSRCFAGILLQLDGPDVIAGVEGAVFSHLANSYFTLTTRRLSREIFGIALTGETLLSVGELCFVPSVNRHRPRTRTRGVVTALASPPAN
jgi:hypothetical protein